jgi:hypothetical protein
MVLMRSEKKRREEETRVGEKRLTWPPWGLSAI